jgi:hypothetical protein
MLNSDPRACIMTTTEKDLVDQVSARVGLGLFERAEMTR